MSKLNKLIKNMKRSSHEKRITCTDALNDQDNWTINLLPDQLTQEFKNHLDTFKPEASNLNNDSAYYLTKYIKYHFNSLKLAEPPEDQSDREVIDA